MRLFVALSVVLLATSTSASPVITVPLTEVQHSGTYLKGTSDAAAILKARVTLGPVPNEFNAALTNVNRRLFTTMVGIGIPLTEYSLIVDTGISNIFIGKLNSSVKYTGREYIERVAPAPRFDVYGQSIGVLKASSFSPYPPGIDGILGLGPIDLTVGTLSPDTGTMIISIITHLQTRGRIGHHKFGIYFGPSANKSIQSWDGALTYGGADPHLHTGNLTYVRCTRTLPARHYFGFNMTSCTYGTHTIIPFSTAGVIISSISQILLADDFFDVYMNAIPGATFDSNTGLIEIPTRSISLMQPLHFKIADHVLTMDVAAQLIPTDQNKEWGGVAGKQYGVVGKTRENSGKGFDFVLGVAFMQRYYTVFGELEIGFAQTNNTFTTYQG